MSGQNGKSDVSGKVDNSRIAIALLGILLNKKMINRTTYDNTAKSYHADIIKAREAV